jgi:UDP-N-acetylglucosamine 2-epimerase (hydrolysing)
MKKILFITGTRADYGKIKSLLRIIEQSQEFEAYIYVSGMHLLKLLGDTYKEVLKDGWKNIYVAYGLSNTRIASYDLGNVICDFTGYIRKINPDMIVVHGDRIDALAGAAVGALNNILVAHIEGGELSGTVDESIRHAISKFAHIHFVSNEEAKLRLIQLGESEKNIYIIGSPDIDLMLSGNLPSIEAVKKRYEIPFKKYGIVMYHPVTTEFKQLNINIKNIVDALIESKIQYIVVYPNNDLGYELILNEYRRLEANKNFRVFPSLRFEYFLTLLKNADFIIGNSSAGIREAAIYGIPAIDLGNRQTGRYDTRTSRNIQHVAEKKDEVLKAISKIDEYRFFSKKFGDGRSTERFYEILCSPTTWKVELQKRFHEHYRETL